MQIIIHQWSKIINYYSQLQNIIYTVIKAFITPTIHGLKKKQRTLYSDKVEFDIFFNTITRRTIHLFVELKELNPIFVLVLHYFVLR